MEVLPQIGAVLAVFALLGVSLLWLRKRGLAQISPRLPFGFGSKLAPGRNHLLQQIDRLQLSPTHSLSAVKMGDRLILIGTSPSGFCLVESSSWKPLQSVEEKP